MSNLDTSALIAAAHDLLLRHWNLSGEMERLPGENLNYLVTGTDGEQSVLKITLEPHADIELEEAMLGHLDAAGFAVPVSIPTVAGPCFISADLEGRPTCIRLQRHLPGTQWRQVSTSPQLLRTIGATLARMHQSLEDFEHPGAGRTHDWDLAVAGMHRDSARHVPSTPDRIAVEQCFHLHAAIATPLLSDCPRGMLHGDFNDENILMDGDAISGFLDFGDCLEGALIQDLGLALAYALEQEGVTLEMGSELVSGYDDVRPLSTIEQTVLFPLALARLATYVCVNAARHALNPGETMRNLHADTAWAIIHEGTAQSPRDVEDILCSGCRERRHAASTPGDVHADRDRHVGSALSLNFNTPLHIIAGRGQYLHAADGRPYLDLVNNVCHVGHCHPRVVEAIAEQAATLNTNTRYLHEHLGNYARRLCATMPDSLDTCFLVNSGSEANELALRLARAASGARDVLVIDGAYHGHTDNCIAMSPYKFNGPGGPGPSEWVHVVPMPDTYRGSNRDDDAGNAYALEVADVIGQACTRGRSIAGFFAEPMLSCGGQVPLPPGYLPSAFEHVRNAGGLCIADEVQVGFGRLGDAFWGFELHDVVPDIVVLGKPIGNGHPMGAVITTKAISDAFDNGMEFFSTFGGNPVSCACGLAVLDVIEQEGLQERARVLGERFMEGLKVLKDRHELIGDVRGRGLFLGIELVRNHDTLEPAAEEAARIVNSMRDHGVLLSTDGPLHNVIKIKPPMVLDEADIDMTLRLLDDVMGED